MSLSKEVTSEKYWFDNPLHKGEDNYGSEYYANTIFKNLILNIQDIPDQGYIVVLGTNRCVSFNILCNHFGKDRCIGYDLYNPVNHPRVITKNVMELSGGDDIPIAFCHNDIGSFPTTPKEKIFAQKWAASNVVKGGYFLGRNNLNVAGYRSEEELRSLGFKNYMFEELKSFFNLSTLDASSIEGHMLSRRLK